MFHRANTDGAKAKAATSKEQNPAAAAATENTDANQAKDGTPVATQNKHVEPQKEKEAQQMNTPSAKTDGQAMNENTQAEQGNMPGGAFQRPGQPQAARAYPGSYPGASAGSYAPQSTANDATGVAAVANGRKLVIGQGITLSGEIEACDHLIVEGTVEAALKGASVMDIAESGAFYGTVEIEEATVAGRFEGDLTVKGRLTIRGTGAITGAIAYGELEIEAGASLDGKVSPLNAKAQSSGKGFTKGKKAAQQDDQLPFADKAAAE